MNRVLLYSLILAAVILLCVLLLRRDGGSSSTPVDGDKLHRSQVVNVYSSRKEELIKDLFSEFTARNNIKVNYINDDPSKLIARMSSEGRHTHADLFLTADVINLLLAENKGLLSAVDSKVLENNIPANLRGDNWFALTKRTRIIVYAKDRVDKNQLSTYEDLADPKWNGRILMRSSSNSYNQSLLASIIAADGQREARRWVRGLVANLARQPSGGDVDQIRAVAAGEGDIAIVNSYYVARIFASKDPDDIRVASKIGVFFPNQEGRGTMVNISGGGVVKHGKNRANAILLLEFMMSPVAQQVYAEKNQEYPVLSTIRMSGVLSDWGDYKKDPISLKHLLSYMDLAVEISDQEGWR